MPKDGDIRSVPRQRLAKLLDWADSDDEASGTDSNLSVSHKSIDSCNNQPGPENNHGSPLSEED